MQESLASTRRSQTHIPTRAARFKRRFARLDDIERRLIQTPSGLSTTALARAYGVDRSTIYRDMGALEERGTGLIQEGHRWKLDHRRILYATHFTAYELVSLYIAARLLTRYSDEQNPHVIAALNKLADALHDHSTLVSQHIAASAHALAERPANPEQAKIFEAITQSWLQARKIRLMYQSLTEDHPVERLFSPYVIEPSGLGYSIYIIGFDDLRQGLRTLKLDRISSATVTDELFDLPADFDPTRLLASAWGIIWNQEGQVEVRLRFNARASRRLRESVWHPSQRLEDLPDGSCLFTVYIGSLTEIRPWIRQWGADVEALSPPSLRDELAAEAQALVALYPTTNGE